MRAFAINANDVDAAGLELDVPIPVAWLDEELGDADVRATAPGHLKARLSRSQDDIVVRGKVTAALAMPCARCLEPARFDVAADLSLLLTRNDALRPGKAKQHVKHDKKHEDEREFSSEEADHDEYDGETVVLDPFLREALLLEAPNFPLCSEACPGIRPGPETPKNEARAPDPRLAKLSALKDRLAAPPAKQAKSKKKAKG